MEPNEGAEITFFNGKIVTLDSADAIVSAVAIRNGRILAVGKNEEVKRLSNSKTRLIDLKGKTMLPGFIDSHAHLAKATLSLRFNVDGRCPPNRSVGDILERIRQRVRETPKGHLVMVHGNIFGNLKLAERRWPTKAELDWVAPEHPIVLIATAHTHIANTCALRLANITRESSDPSGGEIERDELTGEPTGVLNECMLFAPSLTYEEIKETLRLVVPEYWLKQGFTTAYSFVDCLELRAYQELLKEQSLPLRVQAMISDPNRRPDSLESLVKLGILPGLGNDWVKIGGVKIFVDGAFMGLSAATYDPYLGMKRSDYCGLLRYGDPQIFNDFALKAHNAGLSLCVHAIGDKAQDWALNAYEYVLKANPRYHRHRIEHFGNVMTNPERIHRARAMGIIPITTVEWLYAYGDFIRRYLGHEREKQSFVLRSMIEAGLRPANCSDCAGSEPLSINPFFSIWCAVTRQTFFGNRLIPDEAITVKEALQMYTVNAAYAGFEENWKGSIEPGKFADLIVISRDILTIPKDQIKDIEVEMTIIEGKIVYQR